MTGVFGVVLGQILLMFLYLIIGYVLYRTGLITQEGSKALAHLLLYCVLPCVVLKSFCIEYSAKGAVELAVSIAAGAGGRPTRLRGRRVHAACCRTGSDQPRRRQGPGFQASEERRAQDAVGRRPHLPWHWQERPVPVRFRPQVQDVPRPEREVTHR